MKKIKATIAAILAATMVISSSMIAFAGQWQQTDSNWKYQNDDSTYATNGWQWIDGNQDGTAECYYFDANGIMLANTTTPDGYTVDASGAWTELGIVRTKAVTDTTPIEDRNIATSEIPSGYNENGLSNVAIDLLEHTRAENSAKYGEIRVDEIAGEYNVFYNDIDLIVRYYQADDKPSYVQSFGNQADKIFKAAPMTGKAKSDKEELMASGYSAVTDDIMTVVDCGKYECQLSGSSKFAKVYIKFDYTY